MALPDPRRYHERRVGARREHPDIEAENQESENHGPILSVVIPLLDEAASLRELHLRLGAVLHEVPFAGYEIIFVNDGSTDGSVEVLEEIAADDLHVVLIELARTFGKTAALAAGFRAARGDVVVTLDADLQDVPEEIPRLLESIQTGADLVTGRKQDRRDPWTRCVASKLFNWVVSRVGGVTVRDVNSGFKAMRAEVAQSLPMHGELHRYLPVLAHAMGFRIAEVAVKHHPRRFGRSRYRWGRYVAGLLDTIMALLLTRYARTPLHFFGLVGVLLTLLGGSVLAYLSIRWFAGHPIGNRPLFALGEISLILGVQSVFFGLLAQLTHFLRADANDGCRVRRVLRRPIRVRKANVPHARDVGVSPR